MPTRVQEEKVETSTASKERSERKETLGRNHPRVSKGFANLAGVLTKSSKNRKMRHPGVP